jgi:selenide,water dikinase
MTAIKLTEYSHGAGCGCKISPRVLSAILKTQIPVVPDDQLLVGNTTRDDAAVYDLGDGTAVISTTDFFMPIADDAFTFGRIAAANAISDVYAMGGTPMMAIAILGWPINKLAPEVAQQVIEGGRDICREAGIPLAGGHSIDSPEPIFGLAVTGRVNLEHLKKNDTARAGDLLYLTKPLGVGVLTTAQKQKKLKPEHDQIAIKNMCQLNNIGQHIAKLPYVNAMTDVTGFGLGGHLVEMCQGAQLSATVFYDQLPRLPHVDEYLGLGCIPGGTLRNFESYGAELELRDESQKLLICDPQTSGGLLVAVDPAMKPDFELLHGSNAVLIGAFDSVSTEKSVKVL